MQSVREVEEEIISWRLLFKENKKSRHIVLCGNKKREEMEIKFINLWLHNAIRQFDMSM
jgi:hypothetical protein